MRNLDQEAENGSLEAYEVPSSAEQVQNWLSGEIPGQPGEILTEIVRELCASVAILKSINVDEDCRGEGIGNDLMTAFFDDIEADVVLLIADAFETQADGFDLKRWYEGFDFAEVYFNGQGPLMIYPSTMAEVIREKLAERLKQPSLTFAEHQATIDAVRP